MHLHLISFDVPYPANYGGVIDVFHKIRALADQGAKIHLHCFRYGREEASILEELCESVHYYERRSRIQSLPVKLPHIVSSRRSKQLLNRLMDDSYPVLFEGLHSCYYLDHPYLEFRQKLVRMHNVEWEYYYQLGQRESRWARRQYLLRESQLLQAYEKILFHANYLLTISPDDTEYYRNGHKGTIYLPAFHPYDQVQIKAGRGEYCLYHGKLSVPENHEAAMFLIREVFQDPNIPLIIAGLDPLPELIELIYAHDHITLRHNPGEAEMFDLMRNAQVHVLPTFQATGIKLKLISALFTGRFCLVTPQMVEHTGLERCCVIAEDLAEMRSLVSQLFRYDFPEKEVARRQHILEQDFSNRKNARRLLDLLER